MALSIADQIALDDALVAPADRLKIGKCNLRLSSDITSRISNTFKWSMMCLKLTSVLQQAFQVNVMLRIYMRNSGLLLLFTIATSEVVTHLLVTESIIIFIDCLGLSENLWKSLTVMSINSSTWRSFAAVINQMSSRELHHMTVSSLSSSNLVGNETYSVVRCNLARTIPPRQKEARRKANTDAIPKLKPPPLFFGPKGPDAHDYDSEDDISWKSSDDDQDDEQDQDDDDAEKHDVNETTQEEEDDDDHDNDENDQEDDDARDDDKKAEN
ncbi:hypothetical protein Tco_1539473 [Tanacetum coccineum]